MRIDRERLPPRVLRRRVEHELAPELLAEHAAFLPRVGPDHARAGVDERGHDQRADRTDAGHEAEVARLHARHANAPQAHPERFGQCGRGVVEPVGDGHEVLGRVGGELREPTPVLALRRAEHRLALAAPHALAARPVRPRHDPGPRFEPAGRILLHRRADLMAQHAVGPRHDPGLEQREVRPAHAAVAHPQHGGAVWERRRSDVANLEGPRAHEERRAHRAARRRDGPRSPAGGAPRPRSTSRRRRPSRTPRRTPRRSTARAGRHRRGRTPGAGS